MEELEFDASTFWRQFDTDCQVTFRLQGARSYERTSLLILFLWTENFFIAPNRLPGHDAPKHELQDWWAKAVKRLNQLLQLEFHERIDDNSIASEFLSATLKFLSTYPEFSFRTAAFYFDYRFMYVAEEETGSHRLLTHYSASLANALNDPNRPFVDVFCSTGELFATRGNERWRRQDIDRPNGYFFQVGNLGLEVRLRLTLHGKANHSLERVKINSNFNSKMLLRIDPPPRKAIFTSPTNEDFFPSLSPMAMFEQLQHTFDVGTALIVVSGADRSSSRSESLRLRARLFDAGKIVAVIDFPKAPGARVEKSAWILAPRSTSLQANLLMVNTSALGVSPNQQEYGALAEFAGRLVRLFLGRLLSSRWATTSREDSAAHLRHLFDREFIGGYGDVAGLCKVVSAKEIRDNNYTLLASSYVVPAERSAWLSGIDGTPLLDLIFSRRNSGGTFYLIGNNGEGKSLLLREIAKASSERQRKTIGISCSASDRFPLPAETAQGFESFTYEGARTSNQAMNLKRLAREICRKFQIIHKSERRLELFEKVLRLIDFDARRYLIPINTTGAESPARKDWLMAHTIELVSDAKANENRLKGLSSTTMQIALMRSSSKGGITPFLDLSSGEQQIVSLVAKIITHAEQGCLILIDEPEISLHVSWQRVVPRVFSVISNYFSCDILTATHSPLLISSIADNSSVCFSASMQRLTTIDLRDRRSVESVLFKGFHTYTANNRLIHERCATIVSIAIGIMNTEKPDHSSFQLLLSELSDIRRTVLAASEQLDRAGIDRSLEVIKAARETLQELTSLKSEQISEEDSD